jgi:hypothetical protein
LTSTSIGAVALARGADQLLALGGLGDVGGERPRLTARGADRRDRGLERARQLVIALAQRARGADHSAAFGREEPRDLGADAARGARHHRHFAVQFSHGFSRVCR